MSEVTRYSKPPIVERIIGVYHPISQEQFEAKLPSWEEKIQKEYPISEPLAEWMIDIEDKNGVPFIKSLMPKARLRHIYWKRHAKNLRVRGTQLRSDRLVFHLRREEENAHDFNELIPEMERWLAAWMEHFEVNSIDGITVEYFNLLNAAVTPQLIDEKGGIKIADSLTIFGKFPGTFQGVTNPYDCKVRLVIDREKPVFFDVHVHGVTNPSGVAVDFAVRTAPRNKSLSASDALVEIKAGHDIILEHFACFFTDSAQL